MSSEFARLSRVLSQESGSAEPGRIVRVAAQVIPHADHCAITVVVGPRRPHTVAATGQVPVQVDAIQYATGEGPCLEALSTDGVTVVDDLRSDERWPMFARRCTQETPVLSMLSTRLRLDGERQAALNVYAQTPGQFEDLDIGVASMFAPFVALSLQSELDQQRVSNLEIALSTSRQIGTAVGILMARELVTSDQAFAMLREASQHLNRKLHDIADEVVDTGVLPALPKPEGSGAEADPGLQPRRRA